jgi:hypothetical protein
MCRGSFFQILKTNVTLSNTQLSLYIGADVSGICTAFPISGTWRYFLKNFFITPATFLPFLPLISETG